MHAIEAVAVVAVGALILLLLHPNASSHALSSRVSQRVHGSHYMICHSPSSSRNCKLMAVAENQIVSEACREVDDVDVDTLLPTSALGLKTDDTESREGSNSISTDMKVMRDFWGGAEIISTSRAFDNVVMGLDEQFGGKDADIQTTAKYEKNNLQDNLDGIGVFGGGDDYSIKVHNHNEDLSSGHRFRSAMAKSAMLQRAGISTLRAKSHVNKTSRFSGKDQNANAITRVLGTVRTAAAAAALVEHMNSPEKRQPDGMTADVSSASKPLTANLKSLIESTVTDMLKCQYAPVDQHSVDDQNSPPPGTTSMGILGDVVQDKLPDIPPFPGTYLVGKIGDIDDSKVAIRTSIPHSSDDTHIANLRLSVFSRFDEERQQMFRRQSIEVLNSRRKRGAVVLVAESGSRSNYPCLSDMQSRIVHGHRYGEKDSPQRGQRSVPSIRNDDAPSRQTVRGLIIGSVECSHQEFRGTILGNSRPEGSLMYVTEVAVRPDARRCGAGAMLMRGVAEVASLRNIESIYLHVDVTNQAALAMYEKSGYHYLDMREPMYAQFTASLNLHDGATHGRKHHLMCKHLVKSLTWLEDYDSIWDCLSRL